MTLTLHFQGQIFNNHILWMGRSIDLEWRRCELDTMLDAQWACFWATVHSKYIGQVMESGILYLQHNRTNEKVTIYINKT